MIYLDTNIFLNPILATDSKSDKCLEILSKIASGKIEGCTSILTWDEFLYVLQKKQGVKKSQENGKALLATPNLIFIEAGEETIKKAQNLVENYQLKPRDAIHAATAILNNCIEIASDDKDFDKIKELKRIKI